MSLVMLLSITVGVDLSAYAIRKLTTGKCGENVTYSFDNRTDTLTISGKGKMYCYDDKNNYSPFYDSDFYYGEHTNITIKSVVIRSGVTSIGDYAFLACDLTSITIPNSVTSIGNGAFTGCGALTSITIPNSVTSIGNGAFTGCGALTSITIPNSVTSIGNFAFKECRSLTSINVSKSNKNYSSQSGVLFNENRTEIICYPAGKGDESYTIPAGVTSIGDYAFYYCDHLTSISISDGVKSIGNYAFYRCDSITSITIPDGVTSIGDNTFEHCYSLKSIAIPNSVTNVGDYAFHGCESLKSITIPDSVTSIGDCVFSDCSSLTSINVSENNKNYSSQSGVLFNKNKTEINCYPAGKGDESYTIPDSVTSIGNGTFYDCESLTNIIISDGVTRIGNYVFDGCESLTSITIPDGVTSIGNYVFYGCESLTSITIPDGVTSIGNYVFYGCEGLTNIIIPDGVTSIGNYVFDGCESLTSITIPNSVTSIGDSAFCNCKSLTNIIIPNSVKSIGKYAFSDCDSLKSITVPNSVTSIGNFAFKECRSLTSINVSKSNKNYSSQSGVLFNKKGTELICCPAGKVDKSYIIPAGVTSIGERAFYFCTGMTSITIPKGVTSIGERAFYFCTGMTSITIPDSVTSIGKAAFYHCISLVSITIPKGVTIIDDVTFRRCDSLTNITIQNGVKSIGVYAFSACGNLKTITIPASVRSIGSDAFMYTGDLKSITILNKNCTLDNPDISSGTKIIGFKDSTAISYAKTHKNPYSIIKSCNDYGLKHHYKNQLTPATDKKDGAVVKKCTVCGYVGSSTKIYKASNIALSKSAYTYSGEAVTPAITVKDSKGKKLSKGKDYTVSYSSGRKNVGRYAVKIKLKGNYSGTVTKTFDIVPKGTSIKKISASKKGFKVYWKAQKKNTTGYEIQYSTAKSFKNAKTVKVSKNSATSQSVAKLIGKKKYFVRVRTYKTVKFNGKKCKVHSSWSTPKTVVTKK